ncbi:MAG: hypothetical protein H6Q74_1379 [Firmicutes bacterium]|nr:hypothetical protein [Bacillota bacterium]
MSTYTDIEHEKALSETLYWENKQLTDKKAFFAYAQYQYALKDYIEAVAWYKKAADEQYIPAIYQLAYCMRYSLGISSDCKIEERLFQTVLAHDDGGYETAVKYRLGMSYTYGFGTQIDEVKGLAYFNQAKEEQPQAIYELGLYYKSGKGGVKADKKTAETYFREAYDRHCEQAIFELFAMFEGNFEDFAYVREIKEAYSFKLGQLMRVAELRPCKEYFTRLADLYQQGYPGDTNENLGKFARLAQKYLQKAAGALV